MSDIKITEANIDKILQESSIDDEKMGEKTTVIVLTMKSGFEVIESSSCVDPANYDHELGKKICMERIKDKIWELEGYRLQDNIYQNQLNK